MTESTEWVIAKREPMQAILDWATKEGFAGLRDEIAAILAAPTPAAPDMEVVRECQKVAEIIRGMVEGKPHILCHAFADSIDRMAAALSAQARELQEARMQALSDEGQARELSATAAAQARKIEGLERENEGHKANYRVADAQRNEALTTVAELRAEVERLTKERDDARDGHCALAIEGWTFVYGGTATIRAVSERLQRLKEAETQRDAARLAFEYIIQRRAVRPFGADSTDTATLNAICDIAGAALADLTPATPPRSTGDEK